MSERDWQGRAERAEATIADLRSQLEAAQRERDELRRTRHEAERRLREDLDAERTRGDTYAHCASDLLDELTAERTKREKAEIGWHNCVETLAGNRGRWRR